MSCGCGCNGTPTQGCGCGCHHGPAPSRFALVGTLTAAPGKDGGRTPPLDTTGADLIVVHVAMDARQPPPVLSDSEMNTWIPLAALDGTITGHRTWYAKHAMVSAVHTFDVIGTQSTPGVIVHAFRGSDGKAPLQLVTGSSTAMGTSLASNPVTPALNGALVLAWFSAFHPGGGSVSGGLITTVRPVIETVAVAAATGYVIQTDAAPIAPVWEWPVPQQAQAGIAVFNPAVKSVPVRPPHTLTARDIITASLRSIRVLGVGDPLEAEDANDALNRLNDWLDSLALERLTMYFVTRTCKRLGSGICSYTIGLGGDINIPRPTHIEAANLIQDVHGVVPFEKPIDVWTDQRWQGCRQKSLTSTYPTAVYYDHNWQEGLGRVYVWPVPTDCGLTELVLYTPVALLEFPTLDTAYSFPPGYRRFIRTNFTAEIASEYGKQLTADQQMAARQAKAQIKRGNVRPAELRVDAALVRGYDYFDWRTGEPR